MFISLPFASHCLAQFCFIFLIPTEFCMKVFADTTGEIFGPREGSRCQQNNSKLLFYIYSLNYFPLSCQTRNDFHISTCCISHVHERGCGFFTISLIFIIGAAILGGWPQFSNAEKLSFLNIHCQKVPRTAAADLRSCYEGDADLASPAFFPAGSDHVGRAGVIHGQTHFLQQRHGSIVKL